MKTAILTALALMTSSASLMAETAEGDSTVTMNEVAVVATPKESGSMRQEPSSVTLVSSRELANRQVTSLKGVSNLVPNLFQPDYGSRLTSAIYIRGIGSRINTPAVGLYVDNIPYVDKSAFDFHLYDIERVDVLRGPQATLYGRNAMGGIVKVYTRNPFDYQGTDIHLGYESREDYGTVSLAHYHRPSSKLAFSVGGYYESGDGFFRNANTGLKVDGMDAGGGRVRAIWKPRERLTLDFTANYDYSDEGAYPYYYTGTLKGEEQYGDLIGKITNNRASSYRRSMLNTGLNLEYRHPKFTLNAITGYQNLRDRMFMDQDFMEPDIYTLEQRQRIHTLSEEVIVKSPNKHGRWQWLNGVNVMYQRLHTTSPVNFYADGITMLEQNISSNLPDLSQYMMSMAIGLNDDNLTMGGTFDTPTLNLAVFHQSTVQLWKGLDAILGLRCNYDRLQMQYDAPATVNYNFSITNLAIGRQLVNIPDLKTDLLYNGTLKNDYLQLLPKVALRYRFDDRNNIYASASMGQRSGGYNLQMFSDLLQGSMRSGMISTLKERIATDYPDRAGMTAMLPDSDVPTTEQVTYKPEYNWSYEVGTHLATKNGRLQGDAAVYYMQIRNQQIARFADSGLGRRMVNAGRSESYGFEVSGRWMATDALLITANYGYTHATFKRYVDGSTTTDENGETVKIDYSGNYVPFVPQHHVAADASYTFSLKNKYVSHLTLGANYTGTGRIYWTESNRTGDGLERACQNFYSLLGAYLTLSNKYASLQVWGRNLTNTHYNTFYFESASRGYEQHGKPLQVGIDIKIHF